jgi:hypothetical protein
MILYYKRMTVIRNIMNLYNRKEETMKQAKALFHKYLKLIFRRKLQLEKYQILINHIQIF